MQAVSSLEALLPSLEDPWGIEPLEALSFVNPHLLVAHTVYHGSRLILYSLVTGKDPSTQLQVFTAAQSLVDLCSQVRGNRGVRRVQAPLILLVRLKLYHVSSLLISYCGILLAAHDECRAGTSHVFAK